MKKCKSFMWVLIALQLIVVFVALFTFKISNTTLGSGDIYKFDEGWSVIREDGTREELKKLPDAVNSDVNEILVMENVLPKQYAGKTLFFLSADKTIKVYVDGEQIYDFGTTDSRLFGKTPGSIENFVDIPENFSEGIIRIEMASPYAGYAGHMDLISVADRDVAILHMFRSNLFNIVCNVLILFAGAVLLLLTILQRSSGLNDDGMGYLSAFCFIMSIYYFIETKMLHMIYGNQTLYSILVFMVLMVIPIFFSLYYDASLKGHFERTFKFLFILSSINVIAQVTLQVLGVFDFMEMAFMSHVLIFLNIFAILMCHFRLSKIEPDENVYPGMLAIIFLGAGSITDIIRTYIISAGDLGKYSRYGASIYCLILMVVHVIRVTRSYSNSVTENAKLLEREVKNAEEQNRLLRIAKEEAENAKQEAVTANKAKSSFLANMSHEIRTPINAILGMDSMILKESNDKNVTEYARDIQSASRNLLSLINDILDFSKIESGKMDIIEVEYEVGELLNDCYNTVVFKAKDKDLNLTFENEPSIPRRLLGDEVRIRQIIINILNNAIKYTKEGSVALLVGYEWTDGNHIQLVIQVRDTGIGISAEDQKKLFKSFQRLDEKNNRKIEGTGLGLTIVKQLLDLMGGTIYVESKYGLGSTFTIRIPQEVFSNVPLGEFEASTYENDEHQVFRMGFSAPKARILVVDDVLMNLKVVTALLRETRIQVDTATSGEKCLEMIEEKHYDIIFLDHLMPNMDGLETLKRMKELDCIVNKDTPVIMLTANAIVGAREEYLKAGFCDYISKPIKERELDDILLKYLPNEYIMHTEKSDNSEKEEKSSEPLLERLDFLDTKIGMQYSGDNEDFYKEILEAYLINDKLAALQETFVIEDWKNYEILVHAMKSTSLTIGAVKLSDMCKELELAAKRDDGDYIRKHHGEMQQQYEELVLNLRNVLD